MIGEIAKMAAPNSPPKAPNPSSDDNVKSQDYSTLSTQLDTIPRPSDEHWDLFSVSALAAVKMLAEATQTLSDFMGDIPPTPPASRPTTPRRLAPTTPPAQTHQCPMSPISPVSPTPLNGSSITPVSMPSPEAHRDEPTVPLVEVGADAQEIALQQIAISRRFYLKSVPPFSLTDYLLRIHQYCPHSPGVYLAAATYVHRLCVSEVLVPATSKTVHRVTLAAIRIASKVLEDNKWSQDRISKVGGVSRKELQRLEISLCYLLNFELFINEEEIRKRMFMLQQAARQTMSVKRRLSDGFKMKLAIRPMTKVAAQ